MAGCQISGKNRKLIINERKFIFMKKNNLQRMVDFLKSGKVSQEMFDMSNYRTGDRETPECNSVGCVLGWCTELDADNVEANFMLTIGIINFYDWSADFTGIPIDEYEWDFLFSESWAKLDNTIEGAIKRLEYFIKNNQAPDDWDFEEETVKLYSL